MRAILAFFALALSPIFPQPTSAAPAELGLAAPLTGEEKEFRHPAPKEVFDIVWVVDGDTVHITYHGKKEKLRLLSVDTEEKGDVGPTKPATVFGQECALWADEFFSSRAKEGEPARIGLIFPGGKERRDIYGRLLCHVVLEDGTDFNLLLVQLGKSPYFNKYGNSTICHERFVAAQKAAQKAKLGIWNPETNKPDKEGRESASRPYPELLAWWNARAQAIDNFRAKNKKDSSLWIDAEDPEALEAAIKSGKEVHVFCILDRKEYEEDDGSKTLLMRSGDKSRTLRVKLSKDVRKLHEEKLSFETMRAEFQQNYLFVRGKVVQGKRGPELVSKDPAQWSLAGPAPVMPD